jgi:hypothetical protein
MPDINLVNPQINNITDQEISIQVSLGGFSFSIRSAKNKQCLVFRHYIFKNIMLVDELIRKVEQIVTTDSYLSNNYSSATVYYFSQQVTLIPEEFFDPLNLKTYFEFNLNLGELDELHYSHLEEIKAYNVFSIPNYLANILYPISPNIIFEHQSTQLIRLGNSYLTPKKPVILIGINKCFFDLVVFDDNKLTLSNSFQYSNTMDFIYFYLYALKQLKTNTANSTIFVLGSNLNKRKFIDELENQIGPVEIPRFKLPGICRNLTLAEAAQFYNLFL